MKILLMCGAGASSGFMAQAMRKAAKEQGIENFEIIARSEAEMMNNLQGTDLVMFGPHLAFKREALEKDLKKFNIPFAFIDKDAYGSIDGAATLKQALDALREVKKPVEEISVKEEKPTQSSEASEEPAKGFMGWITKSLAPKLDKLTQNIYISAIQQSIMSILPMIDVYKRQLLMAALNITWLIHLLPYFIWLVRRRNMTSSKMLLRQSRIVYGSVVLLICMLIGSLFTVNVLYVIAFTVIFLVFGWLIYRFWKTRYPMGFKVIGSIALLWVTFAIGVNITLTSTYDSLSFQKPMEQTRLSDFVLQHVNTAGLTLDSYSESSMLSEHMSFSAYSEKEDAADKNLYIDWYRIRDGFFRDWTKRRYQSENGMEQMCRGYGEPIKTQGVTMYKGEYEVLFIRDDTYVCINDDFLLDDDGWKLIHELLNL